MSQTLHDLYTQIREQLLTVSASEAQANAETDWILRDVLNLEPNAIYSQPEQTIPPAQAHLIDVFLTQRVQKRIPLQYLLHQAWFYGLSFYVNPHVLIPRPETELLVEQVLKRTQPGMRILDVGTGPGTIAISLSHKLGNQVDITAVDVSEFALKVAALNQRRHQTSVHFKPAGDLLEPVSGEQFDIIVSNPPYVDHTLKPSLQPEVLWHEPGLALFPPSDDPFYFYRRLAQEAPSYLKPGGWLMVEAGAGMTPDISQIFLAQGFQEPAVVRDYAGQDRMVIARWA